jgi:hypothetical protein
MTALTYIHNQLSKDYTPTDEDILCGRGKACGKHPGNKKFSAAVKANLQLYGEASKRLEKSNVVASILGSLRENGARFIKQDKRTKQYHELSDRQAHVKTGHAIRDLLKQNIEPYSSISRLDNNVLIDSDISERLFHLFDDEDDMKAADIHLHNNNVLIDSDISERLFHLFDDEDDMKAADIHLHDKCYGGTPRLVTPGLFDTSSSLFCDDFEREFEISSEDEGI